MRREERNGSGENERRESGREVNMEEKNRKAYGREVEL